MHNLYRALILSLIMPLLLAGCNTMEGVGEDMEAAGGAIDEEAEEEQRD